MAEVTGVRTEFTVQVDVGRLYESGQTVDPATMLALVGSLMEEGVGPELWRELLVFRDERERVTRAHRDLGGFASVLAAGLVAVEQENIQRDMPMTEPPPKRGSGGMVPGR